MPFITIFTEIRWQQSNDKMQASISKVEFCPCGQHHLVIFLQDAAYPICCYFLIYLFPHTQLYILVSSVWCFPSYIKYSHNSSFCSDEFPHFSSWWAKTSFLLPIFHNYRLFLTISQLPPQPVLILSPHRDFQTAFCHHSDFSTTVSYSNSFGLPLLHTGSQAC